MFGKDNRLANLEELVNSHESMIGAMRTRANDHNDVAERRWDYINGEVKRTNTLVTESLADQTIELSHVDAPNIKVRVSLVAAVQALADHLNLGMVPEQDAEIVVLRHEE